jgi:hypothetical protein
VEQTQPKRGRGRPPNPPSITGRELAAACLGKGYREIMEETGLGEPSARTLTKVTGLSVAEFIEAQRPKLQRTLEKLLDKIDREADSLKPAAAAVVYGILHDKHGTEAQRINQAVHIHLKTGDANSALKALFGPAVDSISSARPRKVNNETNPIEVVATPVQHTGPTALDATARDSVSTAKRP